MLWAILLPTQFEPIYVSVPVRLEVDIARNIPTPDELMVNFMIEGVADGDGNEPPMPLEAEFLVLDVVTGNFSFDSIVFDEPGRFEYRIWMDATDVMEADDGLTAWEIPALVYDVVFEIEIESRQLFISGVELVHFESDEYIATERGSYSQILRDGLDFMMFYQPTFVGNWEDGFGEYTGLHMIMGFFTERAFSFWEDGTLCYLEACSRADRRDWELSEERLLLVEISRDDIGWDWHVLEIEMIDNQLRLTSGHGDVRRQRVWWQEGSREDISDYPLIGTWQFSHGDRFLGRSLEMTFSPDREYISNLRSTQLGWEFYEDDLIELEWHEPFIWEVDQSGDQLTITIDEDDLVSVWTREGVDVQVDESWLIADYFDYFEIEEDDRIMRNARVLGEVFEFVIYEVDRTRGADVYYVVVKQAGVVFDVIHIVDESQLTFPRHLNDLVSEVDLNFDGQMDVLIYHGYRHTGCWDNVYSGFIQEGGRFVEDFTRICRPVTNQNLGLLGTWCGPYGARLFSWYEGEFTQVGSLRTGNWRREEHGTYEDDIIRILVNGEWEEDRICWFTPTDDANGRRFCDEDYDAAIYERIFGEHGLWNWESEDWLYLGEAGNSLEIID